ncbi:MAG: HD domain-containing protein [Thermotogae bacterium]|nr:HD domain-containing protein [Thermotogota bacterium]MCL5032475.1 HD domain-containing protein [Thermotogota bacterium]
MTAIMIVGYSHIYIFVQRKVFSFLNDLSNELRNLDFGGLVKQTNVPFLEMNKLVRAFNDLAERFANYKMILDLTNGSKTTEDLTGSLYKHLKKLISFNRISFAKIEKEKVINVATYSDSGNVLIRPYFEWNLSDSSFREIVKIHEPIVIDDFKKYLETHPNSQTIKALINEGVQSSLALPIFSEEKNLGFLFLDSFEKHTFTKANVEELRTLQILISLAYNKTALTSDLLLQTITGFSKLVESKDNETGSHLERMASYSRAIAEELFNTHLFKRIDTQFVNHIYFEAPLHDIGKVGIPDRILLKPAKLDPEEFEIMKKHTTIGYDILKGINENIREHGMNVFEMGLEIARHHHERWDGTGYPDRLKGEHIPLCARIVAVADTFDALTTERPYKKAFDYDASVQMIIEESGTHFDPKVVEAFIKAQGSIKEIYDKFK